MIKNVNIELKELKPLRDLRIIKGNIERFNRERKRMLKKEKKIIYKQLLTDEGELINPMEKLRAVYPNTMLITRERKRQYDEDNTSC